MDVHQRKRKQFLRHLRRLCSLYGILPSSFTLSPTSVERESEPFASGGCSEVYRATFNGRGAVMKILSVTSQTDSDKLHKVSDFVQRCKCDRLDYAYSSSSKKLLDGSGFDMRTSCRSWVLCSHLHLSRSLRNEWTTEISWNLSRSTRITIACFS